MSTRNSPTSDNTDSTHNACGQKSRHPRYRTKLCRNYPLGSCRYGEYCSYLHIAPSPSPATQLAPPIHTLTRTVFYPSISSMPPLTHSGSPSPAPPSLYHAPERDPSGPRLGTQGGHWRDPRTPRAPRSRFHSSGDDTTSPSAGTSVEQWRLSVSADGAAYPPAPPGTPIPAPAALSLKSVPVPSYVSPTLAQAPAPQGGREEEWVGGEALNAHTHSQSQLNEHQLLLLQRPRAHPSVLSRERPPVRHRNQFFKTKPCRFYLEPTGCIKGDRCNFIHESPDEGSRRSSGFVVPAPAEIVSESEMGSGAESSVQGEMSACTSPTTMTEEHPRSDGGHSDQQKKNFYPVTWRVVGGGVMMSGRREVCENFMGGHCPDGADCRFAHPDTNEEEYISGYAEPPPVYSPISPVLSPVVFAYPVIYPSLSSPQPFAIQAIPGPASPSPAPCIPHTPSQSLKGGSPHAALPSPSITPVITTEPSGVQYPHPYSPHRVVNGSTLVDRDQQVFHSSQHSLDAQGAGSHDDGDKHHGDRYLAVAARSVVRPVSTPPTRSDAGVARLFAAEMP